MFTNLTKSIAWQLLVQNNSDIIMALYSKWGSTVALINRNYTRVVVSNVFGTNCTGELFLWVIRWTSHSIAVNINIVVQSTFGILVALPGIESVFLSTHSYKEL